MKRRIRYGRIRHGKRRGHPKSILITQERDGRIYFGISSCNFKEGDKWDKRKGIKDWAEKRISVALGLDDSEFNESMRFPGIYVHSSELLGNGMLGKCSIEKARDMIKYFRSRTCCGMSETKINKPKRER